MKYSRLYTFIFCALLSQVLIISRPSAGYSNRVAQSWTKDQAQTSLHYKIDAGQSKFMARAFSGGLLWFKGHDHFVAIRDFTGDVQLTPGAINPAALQMTVRTDSLVETRDVFTEQQKQIINRELKEIVLETAKYPEIAFKSTEVKIKPIAEGRFQADVSGDLTLHGMTRHLTIPAQVTVSADTLRAQGEFTVSRSDYNVKATSAFHGLIRVRDKIKFTFDIVAHKA